jgi:quercetin dioxygenase-like cupin family protein
LSLSSSTTTDHEGQEPAMEHTLEGWDIGHADEREWTPWGSGGDAEAKVLASGDGYHVVLVRAGAGYRGDPHVHAHTEFAYVLDGEVRNQGTTMRAGDAYVAAAGSEHTDFATDTGATYLSVFKL